MAEGEIMPSYHILEDKNKKSCLPVSTVRKPYTNYQEQYPLASLTSENRNQTIRIIRVQDLNICLVPASSIAVNQENIEAYIYEPEHYPFTQPDLVDTQEYQLQEIIYQFKTSFVILHRERIVNRILSLIDQAKEEEESSLGIDLGSLRNFYDFLQINLDLKYPSITLTSDNRIYASWKRDSIYVVSILFLSSKWDVRFALLKPNNKHTNRQEQFSGKTTIDMVMDKVKQLGCLSLVVNEYS